MMNLRFRHALLAGAVAAAFGTCLSAQAAENLKVFNFETHVGSFKAMGTDHLAHGVMEISFTGTVLVSGLNGKLSVQGNVLKEYEDVPHKKQVFHGTGKLTVDGDFQAVQFFGRELTGRFTGLAIFRLYGEFDKNLETGMYWYDGAEHHDWGTGGMQMPVPGYAPNAARAVPTPRVKVKQ